MEPQVSLWGQLSDPVRFGAGERADAREEDYFRRC